MTPDPCIHLNLDIDAAGACELGRHLPDDCACSAYAPLNDASEEVLRIWQKILNAIF